MKTKILSSAMQSFTFRKCRVLLGILLISHLFCTHVMATEVKPGLYCDIVDNTYRIEAYMSDYQIVTDTLSGDWGDALFSSFKLYGVDEFDYLHEDGRPTLPFYSLDLILPLGSTSFDVTDIQILDSTSIILPYDYTPAQERVDFSDGFSFDEEYYATNSDWYEMLYSIEESNYRFYKGLNISLFPFHYEPESRRLTIIRRAVYEITFDGSNLTDYIQQELSEYDRLAYNFYDNFVEYPQSIIPPINGDKYLIIAADEWDGNTALMEFIDHKESLGYEMLYTKLGDIGYAPQYIRDHIKNLYETEELKYVLLVGNVSGIPFYDGVADDTSDPPSDIYYSCLSKDIDWQWSDLNPSVFIGRWPITHDEELRHVVNKTIASDLHLGEYAPNEIGIFSSGDRYMQKDAEYIYNKIVHNSPHYVGDLQNGSTLQVPVAYSNLKSYLEDNNDNPTWMFIYRGEGTFGSISPFNYGWYNMSSILTSNLDFQPFGFGIASSLGNIYSNENFAREWLSNEQGGITFLGATTESFNSADRYFSRKLFEQLKNKPVMTIGEFVANGKAKYYNPDEVVWRRREVKKYTLYGDPSLYLFGLDIDYNTPRLVKKNSQLTEIQDENIIVKDDIVQLETDVYGDVNSICVYSITGQLIYTSHSNQIDLQGLPSGIYTTLINTNNGQISRKILKN